MIVRLDSSVVAAVFVAAVGIGLPVLPQSVRRTWTTTRYILLGDRARGRAEVGLQRPGRERVPLAASFSLRCAVLCAGVIVGWLLGTVGLQSGLLTTGAALLARAGASGCLWAEDALDRPGTRRPSPARVATAAGLLAWAAAGLVAGSLVNELVPLASVYGVLMAVLLVVAATIVRWPGHERFPLVASDSPRGIGAGVIANGALVNASLPLLGVDNIWSVPVGLVALGFAVEQSVVHFQGLAYRVHDGALWDARSRETWLIAIVPLPVFAFLLLPIAAAVTAGG